MRQQEEQKQFRDVTLPELKEKLNQREIDRLLFEKEPFFEHSTIGKR